MLSYYEVSYRLWSNVTHGEAALKRLLGRAPDGGVNIQPLRSPVELHVKCLDACNLTNLLTLTVVEKLVPQLRETLRSRFIQHVKPAQDFIRSVKIGE